MEDGQKKAVTDKIWGLNENEIKIDEKFKAIIELTSKPSLITYLCQILEDEDNFLKCVRTLLPQAPTALPAVPPLQDIKADFQEFKDQVLEKLERLNTSLGLTKKDVQFLLGKRFVLLDYLGGSSCDVYSAFDNQTNETVAVKLAQKKDAYQIHCEQRVLGMLKSCTGVPKVIDFFEDKEYIFLVIQPVGTSLDNYTVSPSQLVELAPKLLNILCQIHCKNIVHRDIKPSNIIITPTGEPVIIDFGLAACNSDQKSSGFCGTRTYASQNALNDGTVGPQDDFESLCYTLYALEIGEDEWKKESAKRKPTVQDLKSKSAIVKKLCGLWEEKKVKKKKRLPKKRLPTKTTQKRVKRARICCN